jgi:hypothetical protein
MICLGCEVVLTFSPKCKAPQVVRKKAKMPKVSKKSKEGKTSGKERKGKAKGEDPHLPTDAQPSAPVVPYSVIGPNTKDAQMLDLGSLFTMEDDEEDIKHWPAPVASTSSVVPLSQSLPVIGPFATWPDPVVTLTPSATVAPTSSIVSLSQSLPVIGPFATWPDPVVTSTPSAMMAPTSSLVPIAPAPVPESALLPDLDSLIRMDDGEDYHQDNHTRDVEMRDVEASEPTMQSQLDPDAEEDEGPDKPDTENVVVTLVHGDVLVLSGAEFQVCLVLFVLDNLLIRHDSILSSGLGPAFVSIILCYWQVDNQLMCVSFNSFDWVMLLECGYDE